MTDYIIRYKSGLRVSPPCSRLAKQEVRGSRLLLLVRRRLCEVGAARFASPLAVSQARGSRVSPPLAGAQVPLQLAQSACASAHVLEPTDALRQLPGDALMRWRPTYIYIMTLFVDLNPHIRLEPRKGPVESRFQRRPLCAL